jgi:hypothetical protein
MDPMLDQTLPPLFSSLLHHIQLIDPAVRNPRVTDSFVYGSASRKIVVDNFRVNGIVESDFQNDSLVSSAQIRLRHFPWVKIVPRVVLSLLSCKKSPVPNVLRPTREASDEYSDLFEAFKRRKRDLGPMEVPDMRIEVETLDQM